MRGFPDSSRGFTLLEMIVVIAIVLVLSVSSFAAFRKVIGTSKTTTCLSDLRQIGVAINLYAGENNQMICPRYDSVTKKAWQNHLNTYLGGTATGNYYDLPVWWCPAAKKIDVYTRHYAVNIYVYDTSPKALWRQRMTAPPHPSKYVLVGEINQNGEVMQVANAQLRSNPDYTGQVAASFRISHQNRSANYLFVDGHVENRHGIQTEDIGSQSIWRWWDD